MYRIKVTKTSLNLILKTKSFLREGVHSDWKQRTRRKQIIITRAGEHLEGIYLPSHPENRIRSISQNLDVFAWFGLLKKSSGVNRKKVNTELVRHGQEMFGNFSIDAFIGSGSSGKVYKGMWNNETVAIKVIRADDSGMLENAAHEALLSKRLVHPNIVRSPLMLFHTLHPLGHPEDCLVHHTNRFGTTKALPSKLFKQASRRCSKTPLTRRYCPSASSTRTSCAVQCCFYRQCIRQVTPKIMYFII